MIAWDIVAVVTVFASVFLLAACAMWNYGNKQHTDRAPHRDVPLPPRSVEPTNEDDFFAGRPTKYAVTPIDMRPRNVKHLRVD